MALEPNATIITAILGFLAGLLPKLYELVITKRKQRFDYATSLAEQLTKEGKELRQDLRKEIASLRKEVAELREENETIKEENFALRGRISHLELKLQIEQTKGNPEDEQ